MVVGFPTAQTMVACIGVITAKYFSIFGEDTEAVVLSY